MKIRLLHPTNLVLMKYFFRYLASGLSYEDLHFSYRIGKSTISTIVVEVTQSIWNNLYEEFMPLPNKEEEWLKIASGFNEKANFPHCLGAVDGKHIRLRKPSNSGSVYMNYKDFFSIVLLAVVDSDYRFVCVSVGSYGKECDSSIFKESSFWKMLTEGRLNIPEPRPLFTESEVQVPYVIIGDEGFGLHTHLLRPFGGTHLDRGKRIFNYRLTRARRYVECAFGILANKWRILHRPIDLKRETAISVVKACTVLHNLIIKKEGIELEKEFNFENLLPQEVSPSVGTGNSMRNEFMTYFLSETGSVPWQDNKI